MSQPVYKSALINAATNGDRTIVAKTAATIINVHALFMCTDGTNATVVRFESEATGTALTGEMHLGIAAIEHNQITLPFSEVPWFSTDAGTAAGEDLSLEISNGDDVDGVIIYSETKDLTI